MQRSRCLLKKNWGPMIETYITTRETLKGVVLIMDIRRTPKREEMNMLDWLSHYYISTILVLTKSDKLSKTKQKKQLAEIANTLSADKNNLILFSAKSRQGKDEVWDAVNQLIV